MPDDRRLIEDYLPIQAISAEASREKSIRKGHISTLHLWWARRPLVACRAAVYGTLVPTSRFRPTSGPEEKRDSLARANAAKFVERLCTYPGDPRVIADAQKHILEAHAERLTEETGKPVSVEDIVAGRAPRPKVLDMFAGGGAIPLEALRLGCEAHANDLNPVAHIIELCTLVYPQRYGQPDPKARGSAKDGTWAGLAEEVRHWGEWVLEKVRAEIGDLYPPLPDPVAKQGQLGVEPQAKLAFAKDPQVRVRVSSGGLVPVAYLWTRTVSCKNPACKATVPLMRQMWLCKREGRHVALRAVLDHKHKQIRFDIVEAHPKTGLGFDASVGSTAGNATCPFCGTVSDSDHVQEEGAAGRIGTQLICVVCSRPGTKGKVYLPAEGLSTHLIPKDSFIRLRIAAICKDSGLTVPSEPISPLRPSPNARGLSGLTRYGVTDFGMVFTLRQHLLLLHICAAARAFDIEDERSKAVATYLGLLVGRVANQNCAFTVYSTVRETVEGPMGDKKVPMVWDFPETNPFSGVTGGVDNALAWIVSVCERLAEIQMPGVVTRGDATRISFDDESFDAVVTDPPYYDNVPYADIADFFYVWLKRSVGHLYPDHFAAEMTPKKSELTALSARHQGNMAEANREYETRMEMALSEANRLLKRGGHLVIVYAHKTTLGWATLVEALRRSKFVVQEAWPIDTEMPAGKVKIDKAMLASSIFLVASKGNREPLGRYEDHVRPELENLVRERVATLWDLGITGADLVIACVGAGLRAFTRYARVEFANGDEVPAERFLAEVETVVLETILARLSKQVGGNGNGGGQHSLAGVDPATRFYTLWRYAYANADLDAGEAIIFANGTHVELDGQSGVTSGHRALVEKKKGKYRLRDYTERGEDDKLGLPAEAGQPAPLIDALHRTLWLVEHQPLRLPEFLREAQPNREQMRLVAQALAGPALKGGELDEVSSGGELAALAKLTANWRSLLGEEGPTYGDVGDERLVQEDLTRKKKDRPK
ncbi:MAG: DUF1156 domain-containing protein [Planctomycetes bacterium]|nr:DUF1156 domain-containing protein [Planctomycetota bacterium]